MAAPELDPLTGQYTTGHVWNGIKELRTPVPAWWLMVWFACIAFALGYVIFYPSFPSLSGFARGTLDWSTRTELAEDTAAARQRQAGYLSRISSLPVGAILKDPDLSRFAFNGGRAAFAVNCIACHGAGAGGQIGQFPSLIDDDWIWGGSIEEVYRTIRHGIRNGSDEARSSVMPTFGGMLSPQQIEQVADYVQSLNPVAKMQDRRASLPGATIFAENCAACHGAEGQGGREAGAPRLNDAIWLYGGARSQIAAQVTQPRHGVMPAFGLRLSDETVKMLAVYVHSLGGGEPSGSSP